jgi:hypothetical protein
LRDSIGSIEAFPCKLNSEFNDAHAAALAQRAENLMRSPYAW